MTVIAPVFTKMKLTWHFLKNPYSKFHEYLTNKGGWGMRNRQWY